MASPGVLSSAGPRTALPASPNRPRSISVEAAKEPMMRASALGFVLVSAVLLSASAAAADDSQAASPLAQTLAVGTRVRLVSTTVQATLKGTVIGLDER